MNFLTNPWRAARISLNQRSLQSITWWQQLPWKEQRPAGLPDPLAIWVNASSDDQVSALGRWNSPGEERKVKKRSSQQEEESGQAKSPGESRREVKGEWCRGLRSASQKEGRKG